MAVEDCLKISSDGIRRAGEMNSAPTPYDPPERTVSAAGDIWSLGVTLVEILTQWLPSNGAVPPALPDPFAGIARGCLARNPADRSTIPQILNLLGSRAPAVAPRKRRSLPVGAWIVLALVAIVVAGVFIMHSDTGTPAPATPATTVKPSEPQTTPAPQPTQTAKAIAPKAEPEPPPAPEPEPAISAAPVSGILAQPAPEITDQARSTIHGKVKLSVRIEVAPSGAVTDAKLDPPNGSKYFGERALAAVRQWKFEPVSVNGSEIGQRWRVRFEFVKTGTKIQPQRISP
jgi:TonB family protein